MAPAAAATHAARERRHAATVPRATTAGSRTQGTRSWHSALLQMSSGAAPERSPAPRRGASHMRTRPRGNGAPKPVAHAFMPATATTRANAAHAGSPARAAAVLPTPNASCTVPSGCTTSEMAPPRSAAAAAMRGLDTTRCVCRDAGSDPTRSSDRCPATYPAPRGPASAPARGRGPRPLHLTSRAAWRTSRQNYPPVRWARLPTPAVARAAGHPQRRTRRREGGRDTHERHEARERAVVERHPRRRPARAGRKPRGAHDARGGRDPARGRGGSVCARSRRLHHRRGRHRRVPPARIAPPHAARHDGHRGRADRDSHPHMPRGSSTEEHQLLRAQAECESPRVRAPRSRARGARGRGEARE